MLVEKEMVEKRRGGGSAVKAWRWCWSKGVLVLVELWRGGGGGVKVCWWWRRWSEGVVVVMGVQK